MTLSYRTACDTSAIALALVVGASCCDPVLAACTATGTNQTCTNTGTMTGGTFGIQDNAFLTLTNDGGTISGLSRGVYTVGDLSLLNTNNGVINSTGAGVTYGIYVGSVGVPANIVWFHNDAGSSIQGVNTGVAVWGGIPNPGTFVNAGSISGGSYAGIESVNLSYITNSGSIGGGQYGVASGAVDVTNTGTITGTSNSGVFAFGGAATVTNTGGTITGGQFGVRSDSGDLSVSNLAGGTITGTGNAGVYFTSSAASTYNVNVSNGAGASIGGGKGIYAISSGGDVNLTVLNSGTLSGTDVNSGAITYSAIGGGATITNGVGGTISGPGYGLYNAGSSGMTTVNSGTISNAGYSAVARPAIYSNGALTVTNNAGGTITSDNNNTVIFGKGSSFTIANAGTISLLSGTGNVGIYYQDIPGTGSVSLTNAATGTISSTGYGLGFASNNSAMPVNFVNAGTISSYATTVDVTGRLTLQNTGSITSSNGNVTVFVQNDGSTITNSGTISNAAGNPAILYAMGTTGHTLNIDPGAKFIGGVDWQSNTGNIIRYGTGSYTTPVLNYMIAGNAINLNNANQVLITSGLNGAGNGNIVVTQAAPITSTAVTAVLPDFTRAVFGAVGGILDNNIDLPQRIGAAPGHQPASSGAAPLSFAPSAQAGGDRSAFDMAFNSIDRSSRMVLPQGTSRDAEGNLVWARGFGGTRIQPATAADVGSVATHYGAMVGYDRRVDAWRVGGFAGAGQMSGWMSDGSGRLRADLYFAGLYGRRELGAAVFDVALASGGLSANATRMVNGPAGPESANGGFGGFFIAPEVSLGYRYALSPAAMVTPYVKLRYNGTFSGGYTERDSSQNASYDARAVHMLEERFGAIFAYTLTGASGLATRLSLNASVFGQQRIGPQGFGASIAGTGFVVNYTNATRVPGGSVGVGFDTQLGRTVALFGSADATFTGDAAAAYAARSGLKVSF
ncbi:hypothetical protein BRAO375_2450006 [Bradyrhizobium sp. ORS 375]|uniref:autotransporter outer membrane beta-barrel domain-containing protein n=1 Tax=Bradyrhizobium sp. (strain ORS 375) TaxID=566679 RepID=UPI0002407A47|nr:autotransporter outer membrane beta-barrel domain-containing protein [Bradyrhizobium sp. ORS 375]CCD93161.1 hypothetical protein BRAO375_2450006 [Bradyrhizobium sp. ORS 375]